MVCKTIGTPYNYKLHLQAWFNLLAGATRGVLFVCLSPPSPLCEALNMLMLTMFLDKSYNSMSSDYKQV